MLNVEKKHYWLVGVSVAVLSFIMLLLGVKAVLGNEVNLKNIMTFLGFSVLVGIMASSLVFFRFKLALVPFIAGLVIGFFEMVRSFSNGMSGWGDLVGIVSLLFWAVIGLGAGFLVQLGYYLYQKFKENQS